MDVAATVRALAALGVRVHCLALGGVDLTSPTGKLTMGVINAVAEFERDLLIERTQAGLRRARAEGKRIGRPASLTPEQRAEALRRLQAGESVSAVARALGTSRQTVMRVRDAGAILGPPSAQEAPARPDTGTVGASSRLSSAFTARRSKTEGS